MDFFNWTQHKQLDNIFFQKESLDNFNTMLELQIKILNYYNKYINNFLKEYPEQTKEDIEKEILYKKYQLEKEAFNNINSNLNKKPKMNKSQIINLNKYKQDSTTQEPQPKDKLEVTLKDVSTDLNESQEKISQAKSDGDKKSNEVKQRMTANNHTLEQLKQKDDIHKKIDEKIAIIKNKLKKL